MRSIALAAVLATFATASFADPISLTPSQMDGVTAGSWTSNSIYQDASQNMSANNFSVSSIKFCGAFCNVGNAQTAVAAGLQVQVVKQSATLNNHSGAKKRR